MHRSVPALALAVLIAAGGAAAAPAPSPAPAPPGGATAAPAPPGTPAPLSLADAVAQAGGGAPAVQIAALRTREAEARRVQALSGLLPSVSGSALMMERTFSLAATGITFPTAPGFPSFPNIIGPVDQVDARVRGTQALFDAASWVRVGAAGIGVAVSREERGGAAETAAQSAAAAYVRATRAQAVVSAREADLALAGQLARLAEDQVQAGTAARIDVIRARTQETTARGAVLVARNQAERAVMDLARALGLDPLARFTLTDTLSGTIGTSEAPTDPEAAVRLAVEKRPDLLAERARQARALREQRAINAERLPRLDASADYGLSGVHWGNSDATYTYVLSASVPVFDGARREGRLAEQRAVARESEVRAGDLERQVAAEVRGAALEVASGVEQEGVALERIRLAEEELAQAQERFRSGVAGNIELINAQSSLLRARDALIDARTATATARISLARAAGVARTVR